MRSISWLFALSLVACANEARLDGDFVEVPVDPRARGPEAPFYLAIAKRALGQKYFMNAYVKELYPRIDPGMSHFATKVVTFELHEQKLYVFDADDRKRFSSEADADASYDPDVVIDAYDLVEGERLALLPRPSEYIVIDPSKALNRFSLLDSAAYAFSYDNAALTTDLLLSRNFRAHAGGCQFDQLFNGHFADARRGGFAYEGDFFSLNGTITIAFSPYAESESFASATAGFPSYFFSSDARAGATTAAPTRTWLKWHITPGMEPIVWTLSANAVQKRYGGYQVVATLQAGIEAWNDVFGFRVFRVQIAPEDTQIADDENVFFADPDASFDFAFADMRSNPNTGEIRGASVYFSAAWIDLAKALFEESGAGTAKNTLATFAAKTTPARLAWNGLAQTRTVCPIGAVATPHLYPRAPLPPGVSDTALVEGLIANIAMHEVGHTLGLRHNFKGSLAHSSVMDYLDYAQSALDATTALPYDIDAIRYLYGASPTPPAQPFCTDEDLGRSDPTCDLRDYGADPLFDTYAKRYHELLGPYLRGDALADDPPDAAPVSFEEVITPLFGVLDFVRLGRDANERARAWTLAADTLKPDIAANTLAMRPEYGERADRLMRWIWEELLLGVGPSRTPLASLVVDNPDLQTTMRAQLAKELANSDGARSMESRRRAIDVLAAMQTIEAYRTLIDARAELTTARASADAETALYLDDLIARATAAVSPYFQ